MRKAMVGIWLLVLAVSVGAFFWYNEWVYSLPTPVPVNYQSVATGTTLAFPAGISPDNKKPLFLHFFNPDCPCSRFNIRHVKSLVKEYGHEVRFAVVLMTNKNYTEKDIQDRFDLDIPVLTDSSIAKRCGVYSTPQAVIIKADQELYYRGNYNKSRYCTDKKTNYAQIALESLLHQQLTPAFDQFALKAYGCQLPVCTK